MPERLYGSVAGRVDMDGAEREREAAWILQQLNLDDTYSTIKPAIVHALEAMVVEHLEPPYINQYQSEYLSTLNIDHLWQIMDLDRDWCDMAAKKRALKKLLRDSGNTDAFLEYDKVADDANDDQVTQFCLVFARVPA